MTLHDDGKTDPIELASVVNEMVCYTTDETPRDPTELASVVNEMACYKAWKTLVVQHLLHRPRQAGWGRQPSTTTISFPKPCKVL